MKVSGLVIQDSNIKVNTYTDFDATYKGKHVVITTNHSLGLPEFEHLKRFNINVINIKTGVGNIFYSDELSMKDAIKLALKKGGLL